LNSGALAGGERRLLLVLPKGIGDVVYGLALVQALHDSHPNLEIHWAVHPRALPLLWHVPAVHRAHPYTTRVGSLWQLRRSLRGLTFDVLLNLGMYLHALPPALLARSKRSLCLGEAYARDKLQWFHDESIPVEANSRVLDVFFTAGRYLGVHPAAPAWGWQFTAEEREARSAFFESASDSPRVALVPCSGRPLKDWPTDRWAQLAGRLKARQDALVVVTGGPSPTEARAASQIAREVAGVRVAVGDDLRRMLWILSGCDLVVGPDTGPLHMARALGVPLLGLYGHTDPRRYGPPPPFEGELLDRYRFDAHERPSAWEGEGGRADRMQLITVDEVEDACLRILRDPATRAARRREAFAP